MEDETGAGIGGDGGASPSHGWRIEAGPNSDWVVFATPEGRRINARKGSTHYNDLKAEMEGQERGFEDGAEAFDLTALEEAASAEVPYIADPVLAPGQATAVHGREKKGKSTWTYGMLGAVERGEEFCGMRTRRETALILTEEPLAYVRQKMERFGIQGATVVPYAAVARHGWEGNLARAVVTARRKGHGIMLVDSAHRWMGFEDENASEAGRAFQLFDDAMQTSGLAGLVISHQRKAGGHDGDAMRGHTSQAAAVSTLVGLYFTGGARSRRRRIEYIGRDVSREPFQRVVELPEDGQWRASDDDGLDPRGVAAAGRLAEHVQKARGALERMGRATYRQLSKEAGISEQRLRKDVLLEAYGFHEAGKIGRAKAFEVAPKTFGHEMAVAGVLDGYEEG